MYRPHDPRCACCCCCLCHPCPCFHSALPLLLLMLVFGDVGVQPPLCLSVELTVAQVAKRMAEIRTDAVILLGQQGDMKGILTDHDVARYTVIRNLRVLKSRGAV